MRDPLRTERSVRLDSLAEIDPEALRESTSPRYKFKYVDISCASNGTLTLPSGFIEFADAPSRARKILRNGDLIVSTVRPNLKAFAHCRLADGPYIASTGFAVLRVRKNVDAYFLLSALLSDDLSKQIESHAVGSNYPAINSSDIRRLQVPAFDSKTQNAIGKVFATIDTAIEQTEALIEKYQHIKAGLMHDLFTRGVLPNGQLRPPREQAPELYQETAIGWIPREWKVAPLGSLCEMTSGGTPSRTVPGFWGGSIPWLKTGEIKYQEIFDTEEHITQRGLDASSAKIFPTGTIVMAMYGEGVTRGRVAFLATPCASNQACIGFYFGNHVKTNYMYNFFQYSYEALRDLSNDGSQKNLSSGVLKQFEISHPISKTEQERIAGRLSALDGFLAGENQRLQNLKTQKLGLMQDLLTGKVAVNVSAEAAGGRSV